MDGGGRNLLHLQLQVDPLEPQPGVLELLRRLRPHWKPQEVHMKVVLRMGLTGYWFSPTNQSDPAGQQTGILGGTAKLAVMLGTNKVKNQNKLGMNPDEILLVPESV